MKINPPAIRQDYPTETLLSQGPISTDEKSNSFREIPSASFLDLPTARSGVALFGHSPVKKQDEKSKSQVHVAPNVEGFLGSIDDVDGTNPELKIIAGVLVMRHDHGDQRATEILMNFNVDGFSDVKVSVSGGESLKVTYRTQDGPQEMSFTKADLVDLVKSKRADH